MVSADEARRRGDEAVRRLRAESARRVDWHRRRRAFSSWCAVATLASGISLAALNAHDASVARQEAEATRAAAEREARIASACAERSARFGAIVTEMNEKLRWATAETERAIIRFDAEAQRAVATNAAADLGCGTQVVVPERKVMVEMHAVPRRANRGCEPPDVWTVF